MRPVLAYAAVAGLGAATAAALLLPGPDAAVLAALALLMMRTGRRGFVAFAAVSIALNVLLLGLLVKGGSTWDVGPLTLHGLGLARGLAGGIRLVAVLGANLTLLSWLPIEGILDGLRLPARITAFLAAVLIAAHDLGRDAQRLAVARRLDGAWPRNLAARAAAGASLLGPLVVLAMRRANVRRDALRLAGHDTSPRFAALVAITALAVASRMAFLALPNLKPTYAIVFLGGLLFGPAVGALAGLLSMALTDVLLTGLAIAPFANAPAMALVGASGGLLRRWSDASAFTIAVAAACLGLLGTAVFSLSSDLLTWLIVPEYRATPGTLRALLLAGLAFNVVPAVANAALFAAAAGPVARAAHAAGLATPSPPRVPREAHVG